MRCSHTKADGTRCRAPALPGKAKCVFHDPSTAADRAEGRRRGGVTRSRPAATLPPETPDLPLRTVADVVRLVGETINHVRAGRLAANVGNCLFVGAGMLLKALEVGQLEERVAALESRQGPHRRAAS